MHAWHTFVLHKHPKMDELRFCDMHAISLYHSVFPPLSLSVCVSVCGWPGAHSNVAEAAQLQNLGKVFHATWEGNRNTANSQ